MHDVLDLRDLVPDEAEQLALSGYDVGTLGSAARQAADRGDTDALRETLGALETLERDPDWPYEEPSDESALNAAAGGGQRSAVDASDVRARIRGAWLGRAVGNTLGKPVEGLTRRQVEVYLRAAGQWPQTGYVPLLDPLPDGVAQLHPSAPYATAGRFTDVPRDDDIDWTILNLHLLERHGLGLTTEDVLAAWLDFVPFTQTYTAERAAYRNAVHALRPPETATTLNPYREWIGALIRGDAFGYVSPGDPTRAARLAVVDARLSHVANGIYGEMWSAALLAAALAGDSAASAISAATRVVPVRSRLAGVLRTVSAMFDERRDRLEALDWVDRELGEYPWVHTLNNAAVIAIGLLWGRTFMEAVGITIAGGRDTDSAAATVGSVYGALHGDQGIPAELVGSTHVHVRSSIRGFDRVTIDELADRTSRLVVALSEEARVGGPSPG